MDQKGFTNGHIHSNARLDVQIPSHSLEFHCIGPAKRTHFNTLLIHFDDERDFPENQRMKKKIMTDFVNKDNG